MAFGIKDHFISDDPPAAPLFIIIVVGPDCRPDHGLDREIDHKNGEEEQ
jgi:hypothetical protein